MWLTFEIKLLLAPPSNTKFVSPWLWHIPIPQNSRKLSLFISTQASPSCPALEQVAASLSCTRLRAVCQTLCAHGLPSVCATSPGRAPAWRSGLGRQKEPFQLWRKPSKDVDHVSWRRTAFPDPAEIGSDGWESRVLLHTPFVSSHKISSQWWNSTLTSTLVKSSHCQSFSIVNLMQLSHLASFKVKL